MGWRERIAQITGRRPAVQPCKAGTADICVIVTRPDNVSSGLAGFTVTLTGPTPGTASTDASGVAEFATRQPGAYKFTVAMPPGAEKKWRMSASSGQMILGGGSVGSDFIEIHPIGTLIVRVYDDLNPRNRVRATTASSVAYLSEGDNAEHVGADLYMTVAAGSVTVNATAAQADLYASDAGQKTVNVAQGGTGIAEFVLPVINRVTPKLEPQADEVWFLRPDPPAPQAPTHPVNPPAPWPALPDEPPVALRVSLHETRPEKSYTGTGALLFDPALIAIYRDAACNAPALASGATLTNGELKAGLTLYMKGRERGAANVQLNLTPSANPHIVVQPSVTKPLTLREVNVVEPKIDVEYQVVFWDRGLHAHQKDDKGVVEKTLYKADATRIELSVSQRGADAPYTLSGRVEAPNCEIFKDEECTQKWDPASPLSVSVMSSKPYPLWLRGTTRGQFDLKLTLTAASSSHIRVRGPAVQKMGVVELELKLFQHDASALEALQVDPGNDPLATYHTNLENKVIPDQVVMTDAQKVWPGRLLHAQKGTSHGRAKLVLKARDASQWPAGTENYSIHINRTNTTGSVLVCDAETDGTTLPFPVPRAGIKASALSADQTWWVEGGTACEAWRDVMLDVALDRDDGGLPKEAKRRADWARFTVVEIEKVSFTATVSPGKARVWDKDDRRYFINTQDGVAGRELKTVAGTREVKVVAKLTKKLEGVPIHFMLSPDAANNTPAGLVAGWKPEALKVEFRRLDRKDRKALLHFSKKTDANGEVNMQDLVLSAFGGDRFTPGAYITQDPHLAKFVSGHATLGKRMPKLCEHDIQVWRRMDVKLLCMNRHDGNNYSDRFDEAAVKGKYESDFVLLERKGAMASPAYADMTHENVAAGWVGGLIGSAEPHTLYFALVDSINESAFEDVPANVASLAGADLSSIEVQILGGKCFDLSAQAQWFKSAKIKVQGGAQHAVPAGSVRLEHDGANHKLIVDASGIAAIGAVPAAQLSLRAVVKAHPTSSGLRSGSAVMVGMRWRESQHAGAIADATMRTLAHESGHAVGSALKTWPDTAATANALWYSQNGNHCSYNTDGCVMYAYFSITALDFCSTCKINLRSRDLYAARYGNEAF